MSAQENKPGEVVPKANDLTGKDVTDFGKEVGKTALVWTLAGTASRFLQSLIEKVATKK